jgi:hypothetical protein
MHNTKNFIVHLLELLNPFLVTTLLHFKRMTDRGEFEWFVNIQQSLVEIQFVVKFLFAKELWLKLDTLFSLRILLEYS